MRYAHLHMETPWKRWGLEDRHAIPMIVLGQFMYNMMDVLAPELKEMTTEARKVMGWNAPAAL